MSGYIGTKSVTLSTTTANVGGDSTVGGNLTVDTNTLYVDSANNRVGVGTTSPSNPITIDAANALGSTFTGTTAGEGIRVRQTSYTADNYVSLIEAPYVNTASQPAVRIGAKFGGGGSSLAFGTTNNYGNGITNTAMTLDSSGNLLVGKTAVDNTTAGGSIFAGVSSFVNDGARALTLVRNTSDGDIVEFRKGTTTVGSIAAIGGDLIIFSTATGHSGLRFASTYVGPTDNSGTSVDNTFDMGAAVYRWDDIYATNGTIQTSDQNEKQQIAELTAAELQAAKAISKLFKTFKWNDSVAEKGDAARTHTGVIAQEVEQAMTDAGLNAGDYAFFISSDWTDGETGEERNRKGIRYPQLMSFIGAATEQRLASIEARLDALEGN